MTDDDARLAVKARQAGDQRRVIAEAPVAMNFAEVRKQRLDVIERVRPAGMARQLDAIPGVQRDGIRRQIRRLRFLYAAMNLGNRLFVAGRRLLGFVSHTLETRGQGLETSDRRCFSSL